MTINLEEIFADIEFIVPEIKYLEWNYLKDVRPCLDMAVLLKNESGDEFTAIMCCGVKPYWLKLDGEKIPYKEKKQVWMPICDDYNTCVEFGLHILDRLQEHIDHQYA